MSSLIVVFFGFIALVLLVLSILKSLIKQPEKNQYGIESTTLNGETVKSKGEKWIADYFTKNNIKYVYEKPVFSPNYRGLKTSIPDFYLPEHNVYVEYWGLVDADDEWTRKRYVRNMKRKMAIYYQNDIKFVSIYPRNLENLDWIFRTKFRKVTGIQLRN